MFFEQNKPKKPVEQIRFYVFERKYIDFLDTLACIEINNKL